MRPVRFIPIFLMLLGIAVFCRSFFLEGHLPIPSDTIIGLYHPFRDLYEDQYPNGIPFKNFLITDPVRQQYPWRGLVITNLQSFSLPTWNPYTMSGSPLLGNFQTAAFYPLSLLLFLFPFAYGWSLLVILQPILAGVFLYLFLRHLKISEWASAFGSTAFIFSGFSISWFEWNTIGHTAMWLPLILLSIENFFIKDTGHNVSRMGKVPVLWGAVMLFSMVCSFFAGHIQTFLYLYLFSYIYFFFRWVQQGRKKTPMFFYLIVNALFVVISSIQWIPTLQFILRSARSVDQSVWQKDGWFIPYSHLAQFLAPDFFGNPTTLNYFGSWNYAELVGYIGILPLLFAVYALLFLREKRVIFFSGALALALLFALPTPLAMLPFSLSIPWISTMQPTRLLFLVDFTLAILAAFGIHHFLKEKKHIVPVIAVFSLVFCALWLIVLLGKVSTDIAENAVSQRNLIFPTVIFVLSVVAVIFLTYSKRFPKLFLLLILVITLVDLVRFSGKFTPFTQKDYLFPSTHITDFLQQDNSSFRIMSVDDRILPPNFAIMYRLQTIEGYDPLFLQRYAELIAANERGKPDISPPFGFNRIITPQNYNSKIIDLLGVKYILSLSDLTSEKLTMVAEEGQTKVYRNTDAFPRAFFVRNLIFTTTKHESIEKIFDPNINLREVAVVEDSSPKSISDTFSLGTAQIVTYNDNRVVIRTENSGTGFLVLTDSYYPTWKARIQRVGSRDAIAEEIYLTNYHFRGVVVPQGEHVVTFENYLF